MSIPSEVALSGWSLRRLSATLSSSFTASESVDAAPDGGDAGEGGVWSRPHPVTKGRAAAEANAARASRRLSNTIRPS